ncbi:RING-H2 finger protein ATL8 [Capsella rubella]|uniref:RING-H2 finger protein ATL8 n=1 Tax=Capsella rubella TaxID=81985 RepID=UPI000CD50507|nr:RING-H2 finger protein ATL8 [Capsella rubella]
MTSPPPPPFFDVSPAAAATNMPDLTIVGFLKSPESFPLYLLIALIVYIVQLRYCNYRFHAICIDEWFQLGSTCPSCRSIPVIYHHFECSDP